MSRVTIEDCLKCIPDRFELTNIAAKRALQIHNGVTTLLPAEDDKPVVIALREIAAGLVDADFFKDRSQHQEELSLDIHNWVEEMPEDDEADPDEEVTEESFSAGAAQVGLREDA